MDIFNFFSKPDMLWNILWVIPLFIGVLLYALNKRKMICRQVLGERFNKPEFSNLSTVKRNLKNWIIGMAVVFLIISAARPIWGMKILPWSGSGRDLMIVLDVSKSMLAEDVRPSRIDHARWFLKELIKSTPGDRYGLVAFSGSAFLECPMTIDKTSIFQIIDEMRPGSIPQGGTNIENAIGVALKAFQAAEGAHRAVILVTDGDELQGNMTETAKLLKEKNIPLYVVGVGDPSQPGLIMVPDETDGKKIFLKDKNGELVKSALNEKGLAKLASECSGIYVRSTATSPCLNPIVSKIKSLVPEKYQTGQNTRPIERFHLPLFIAVSLLLLSMMIGETRKALSALVFFCIASTAFSGEDNNKLDNAPSVAQTSLSLPAEKADNLSEPQTVVPASGDEKKLPPEEIFNTALENQRNKDLEKASELYQKAINQSSEAEIRAKSFQNLGVIIHEQARNLMQSKDLENAEKALNHAEEMYRDSMFSEKKLSDSAMNQQKLINDRKILEELKKQKQEMQDKKDDAKQKTQEAKDENKNAQQDKQDNKQDKQEQKEQNQEQENKSQDKQKAKEEDPQKKDKSEKNQDQDKNQKDKEQNQKDNEQKDPSKEAQRKTDEAKKAVEDYKQEAEKQNSQKDKESASKAEKELDDAMQNQEKKDFDKADENLKKALDALGGKDDKKDKQEKNDKKEPQKSEDKKKDEDKQDKELPKPQAAQGDPKDRKNEDIDPDQAESLLNLMENDEKNFRDEIKENKRQNSTIKDIEKDW